MPSILIEIHEDAAEFTACNLCESVKQFGNPHYPNAMQSLAGLTARQFAHIRANLGMLENAKAEMFIREYTRNDGRNGSGNSQDAGGEFNFVAKLANANVDMDAALMERGKAHNRLEDARLNHGIDSQAYMDAMSRYRYADLRLAEARAAVWTWQDIYVTMKFNGHAAFHADNCSALPMLEDAATINCDCSLFRNKARGDA